MLTKDPDIMLAAMFSGRHALRQNVDGSYFIESDGTHFRYILNFFRDGCSFRPGTLPADRAFFNELLTEAEYYQVSSLVRLLNEHIKAMTTEDGTGNGDDDDGKRIQCCQVAKDINWNFLVADCEDHCQPDRFRIGADGTAAETGKEDRLIAAVAAPATARQMTEPCPRLVEPTARRCVVTAGMHPRRHIVCFRDAVAVSHCMLSSRCRH
jgi:hypothetical protein